MYNTSKKLLLKLNNIYYVFSTVTLFDKYFVHFVYYFFFHGYSKLFLYVQEKEVNSIQFNKYLLTNLPFQGFETKIKKPNFCWARGKYWNNKKKMKTYATLHKSVTKLCIISIKKWFRKSLFHRKSVCRLKSRSPILQWSTSSDLYAPLDWFQNLTFGNIYF